MIPRKALPALCRAALGCGRRGRGGRVRKPLRAAWCGSRVRLHGAGRTGRRFADGRSGGCSARPHRPDRENPRAVRHGTVTANLFPPALSRPCPVLCVPRLPPGRVWDARVTRRLDRPSARRGGWRRGVGPNARRPVRLAVRAGPRFVRACRPARRSDRPPTKQAGSRGAVLRDPNAPPHRRSSS